MSEEKNPRALPDDELVADSLAKASAGYEEKIELEAMQAAYVYTAPAADASVDTHDNEVVLAEPKLAQQTINKPASLRAPKSFWREVLETVILTILIFFLAESVIQPFRIQGSSMDPTFHTDQLLMVNKAAYFHFDINPWLRLIPGVKADGSKTVWPFGGPQRGDVVVFEYPRDPSQDYIKRVIGLPGEKVEVRGGVTYINDKPLNEPYIKEAPISPYGPAVVPEGTLFVMGDNRNGSSDSRAWGFLPMDRIIGKAMVVYWPIGKGWGLVPSVTYK